MQLSLIYLLLSLTFVAVLHIETAHSFVVSKRGVSDPIICLSTTVCRIKCKRYIIRNGCPTCECNPCVYGQPLEDVSCGNKENTCLSAGGLCKVHPWYDRAYCCPKEHDGCCPPMPADKVSDDPDILFPCLPQCETDADCKQSEKCCGTCPPRCMPAVIP